MSDATPLLEHLMVLAVRMEGEAGDASFSQRRRATGSQSRIPRSRPQAPISPAIASRTEKGGVGVWKMSIFCFGCGVHRPDRLRYCDLDCRDRFLSLPASQRAAIVLGSTSWASPGRPRRRPDPLQLTLPMTPFMAPAGGAHLRGAAGVRLLCKAAPC